MGSKQVGVMAEFEIETIGDLKRFIQPFVDETRIILEYAKPIKIKYVLPTDSGYAYLKIIKEKGGILK